MFIYLIYTHIYIYINIIYVYKRNTKKKKKYTTITFNYQIYSHLDVSWKSVEIKFIKLSIFIKICVNLCCQILKESFDIIININ